MRRTDRGEAAKKTPPPQFVGRSYRNPTQVGELNKLRRSIEPSLRNSAISPRNFGIRGGLGREGVQPERTRLAVKRAL